MKEEVEDLLGQVFTLKMENSIENLRIENLSKKNKKLKEHIEHLVEVGKPLLKSLSNE